jgi:hypothetical protein
VKGQIVSILIAAALVVGIVAGFFVHTSTTTTATTTVNNTTTETTVSTYTLTTVLPQGSTILRCVVTEYDVLTVEIISNSSTARVNSTQSHDVKTYETTASLNQTARYVTSSTMVANTSTTTTVTGPLITSWDIDTCTAISSG